LKKKDLRARGIDIKDSESSAMPSMNKQKTE